MYYICPLYHTQKRTQYFKNFAKTAKIMWLPPLDKVAQNL